MTVFCCPLCGGGFIKEKSCYRCEKGHSFDRAGGGYVNLLPPSAGQHGDDSTMLKARRAFLEGGGYTPLANAIAGLVSSLQMGKDPTVFDAGCGEGYYTEAVRKALPRAAVYGVDVAKEAVKMCDKRHMNADFAAASVYKLPVKNESCDLVISVFSPFARQEFLRILRPGGYLISVIPDAKHLWGLKSILYDTPYENIVAPYEVEGFTFLSDQKVHFILHLASKEEILSLYRMTPYCYRTGKEGAKRIEKQEHLDTEAAFRILLYKK
ncbi:MAG: methyltransferase domain-containing protein [Ruminococcaceae bacterium]|nr:methyltransferase domain-containing protein [Oscillospiraceae bacterium]